MKIENLKLIENAGSLVAKFDVIFKPLTVKGFGLFVKADGSRWISEPATKITLGNGDDKWLKHVVITDDAVKDEIERMAKLAYDEKVYGTGEPGSEGAPF